MRAFPSDAEILKVLERRPHKTFRLRELVVELGLKSSEARRLKQVLKELGRRRKILCLKKGSFALAAERPSGTGTRQSASGTTTGARGAASGRPSGVSGRLIAHRDGYGFVVPDDPGVGADIFIPPLGMNSALHGDRVEVHVIEKRPAPARNGGQRAARGPHRSAGRERDKGSRLEGRILTVTARAQNTVVGEFRCGARANFVVPYDRHIPFEIIIPSGAEWPPHEPGRDRQFGRESGAPADRRQGPSRGERRPGARELDGLIVDAEITSFPDPVRGIPPRGRVIEVLGRREDFGVDVEIVIRKYHLPHRFPEPVLEEAAEAPNSVAESDVAGRRDFRDLPIVTIDGETAKDFDDAVFVERAPDGHYRLQVHIADVAHYVRPGTPIDREARLRGTSVYFPDRAVPMLPLELSNGICSLNPRSDRLTLSALMDIDSKGHVTAYEIVPGVIQSAERMTYTAVHAVLLGDIEAIARFPNQVSHFRLMEELALVLNAQRRARGSIDFDLPAPEIEFDEQGRMTGVTRSERNIAHRLIEEFMLAANETVAAHLERCGVPTLYRIHEQPDPKKVLEFEEIAASFGHSLGVELPAAYRQRVHARADRDRHPRFEQQLEAAGFKITSRHYQRLTDRLAGKPEERILSYLMLRSLKQARYSEENTGHFALAAPTYTHFTSPIRRYPDLIVHRTLKALLANAPGSDGGAQVTPEELHLLGLETSDSERRAADAERELMDWKKVTFMSERLGEEFEALVISLTRHGFFVELADLFIEGFVPLDSLEGGRYLYRENLRAVVSVESNYAYRLGDRVKVRLDRIDQVDNRLEFSVVTPERIIPLKRR